MKINPLKRVALSLAILAGVAWLTPGVASAAEDEQPEPEVCYEQVLVQEHQYKRIVETETFKTQYEIDKYVRDRTRTAAIWQNFSPNRDQGTFEGPPSWPNDSRGTWQHKDKPIPPGQAGPDGVYQNGSGNGSWFYRQAAGSWSDWSSPYRWEPIGSHLAWVDAVPDANWQKHGTWTETYQRQWTEYPTGNTREVSTGSVESTFYYTGITGEEDGSLDIADAVWTNFNPGEPWEQFNERTISDEFEVPCPPDTTVPEEPCVPEGVPVTDVNTGKTYVYGTPAEFGYDTCGNPIPDICVKWPSGGYSTLWSAWTCKPVPETTIPPSTTPPTTPPPSGELPATGSTTSGFLIAAGVMTLLGLSALAVRRRGLSS